MTDQTINVTNALPVVNVVTSNDRFLIVTNTAGNAVLSAVSANNLLGNSNVSIIVAASKDLVINKSNTPANSTISVTPRSMWFDDNYLYIAVANNEIKRVALENF